MAPERRGPSAGQTRATRRPAAPLPHTPRTTHLPHRDLDHTPVTVSVSPPMVGSQVTRPGHGPTTPVCLAPRDDNRTSHAAWRRLALGHRARGRTPVALPRSCRTLSVANTSHSSHLRQHHAVEEQVIRHRTSQPQRDQPLAEPPFSAAPRGRLDSPGSVRVDGDMPTPSPTRPQRSQTISQSHQLPASTRPNRWTPLGASGRTAVCQRRQPTHPRPPSTANRSRTHRHSSPSPHAGG